MKHALSSLMKPLLLLLVAVVLLISFILYTFVLIPRNLWDACNLDFPSIKSVRICFPWPGYTESFDPGITQQCIDLLRETDILRHNTTAELWSFFSPDAYTGNPTTIIFQLENGDFVNVSDVADHFILNYPENYIQQIYALAYQCEIQQNMDKNPTLFQY